MNATEHIWWEVNLRPVKLLGGVRQQAIKWTNVDQDLCHYKVSLGHNELILLTITFSNAFYSKEK